MKHFLWKKLYPSLMRNLAGKSICSSSERTWVTPRFEDSSLLVWRNFLRAVGKSFCCLHFVDCTNLRPLCRWAVSAKVISWKSMKHNASKCTDESGDVPYCSNESYQHVIEQVCQKWLKLSERGRHAKPGGKPSRSSREDGERGAFLKK